MKTRTVTEHPLAETVRLAGELSSYLEIQFGIEDATDWTNLGEFVCSQQASKQDPLGEMIADIQQKLRTEASNIVGSSLVQRLQWPLIATAVSAYIVSRRVPDLSLNNIWLRFSTEEGGVEAFALSASRFIALPDDPAAAHPGATVVPDKAALQIALRQEIETNLGELINHVCARLGCKERGIWLAVADRCVATMNWLLQEHNPDIITDKIEQEIASLVWENSSPIYSKKVGLIVLTNGGKTRSFLDRVTCCYWYKEEEGNYCGTCPHRSMAERRERFLASIAEEAS